jgi:hypothetical protein
MNYKTLAVLMVLLFATEAQAGSTKLSTNVVPTPPDCSIAASQCLNSGAFCLTDNTECQLASVSPHSSVSLTSKLSLKGSFSLVRDNAGVLVNTGLVGAADNYVVQIGLQTCTVDATEIPYCTANHDVYVKLALSKGKGSFKIDLRPVFPDLQVPQTPPIPPIALRINHVALITPRAGGNCLGTNSPADILTRLNDGTCNDGIGILGVGGVAVQPVSP